ncbi:MAG: LPXTG cell wall anchor domain-containing protein [Actinomycetota bacterium]
MTKRLALALVALAALFALSGAPAAAQDGPSITVDPEFVEAPGEQEFTVTGAGWLAPPTAIIPCAAPESGNLLDIDSDTCDTGNLVPVTPDAYGNFTASMTVDVTEGGIAIIGFDLGTQGDTESGGAIVPVGAPATEEAAEEGGEEEAAGEEEELANTGVESGMLAIVAGAVLAGGVMLTATQRRRTA